MAKKLVTLDVSHLEADVVAVWGKIINVFDTYANAIGNADTGLVAIYPVARLDGSIGATAVTQHGKNATVAQAGVAVDEFGKLVFAVEPGTYYLNSACGKQGGPMKIEVA